MYDRSVIGSNGQSCWRPSLSKASLQGCRILDGIAQPRRSLCSQIRTRCLRWLCESVKPFRAWSNPKLFQNNMSPASRSRTSALSSARSWTMFRASTCLSLRPGMSRLRGEVADPSSGRLEKEKITLPASRWINGLVRYGGVCPKLSSRQLLHLRATRQGHTCRKSNCPQTVPQ